MRWEDHPRLLFIALLTANVLGFLALYGAVWLFYAIGIHGFTLMDVFKTTLGIYSVIVLFGVIITLIIHFEMKES
jgi:hypothetical protein